jgi:phage gp29-like protein
MEAKTRKEGFIYKIVPKAISQARSDVATWKSALREASAVENPKRVRLQKLYNDILLDAHLTSQIQNRKMQTLQTSWSLFSKNGKVNQEISDKLAATTWAGELIGHILEAVYRGSTLIEFISTGDSIRVDDIPRANFVPDTGMLYFDEADTKGINYRTLKEYGTWLLEFGQPRELGLLNKAVPHVLFKRFAQSCWSELCEIYGIPPRVLKTNTQDPAMLSRGESMMRDMGAASWFIIDETEHFEFAKGADTNGDVYKNLINLCQNEISLLIAGAVIGQDTKHGNESKEKVSMDMLDNLVNADRRMLETYMNTLVLPALYKINALPDGLSFYFDPQEDTGHLWNMTREVLPYMEVDPQWIKDKFGIEVIRSRSATAGDDGFFG